MINDESKVEELLKVLSELASTTVEIGLFDDGTKYEDGDITVYAVGFINEFGLNMIGKDGRHINIPERSFIRNSYDQKKREIFEFEDKLSDVLALKLSTDAFFKALGEHCVTIIKEFMTDEIKTPPNSPTTIKLKGSSNPLIDSGLLRKNITYKIKKL